MGGSISVPVSITERSVIDGIMLVRRWRLGAREMGIAVICCVGINLFTLLWFWIALSQDGLHFWLMLFLLLPLSGSVAVTYDLVTMIVNRTEILISDFMLEVGNRPIRWKDDQVFPLSEISQIFVRERIYKGSYGKISKNYDLYVLMLNQTQRRMIRGLTSPQEALYLERRIEELLHLDNQPVIGAYVGK